MISCLTSESLRFLKLTLGEKGKEGERDIDLLLHLFMYLWLILV